MYLERAHPAFLTTLVVLVYMKLIGCNYTKVKKNLQTVYIPTVSRMFWHKVLGIFIGLNFVGIETDYETFPSSRFM